MAPLPGVLDTVVHAHAAAHAALNATANATATAVAAGTDPLPPEAWSLGWNAVIALCAVALAALQGGLVIFSGDPCHISYGKWTLLVILQAAQLLVVVIAMCESFLEFHAAFRVRLEWLYWVPPCLLTVSLCDVLTDACWTLRLGMQSRFNWSPLAAAGYDVKRGTGLRAFVAMLSNAVTVALGVVLVGWRMQWWLVGTHVTEAVSRQAVGESKALSDGVIGFALGWSLALAGSSLMLVLLVELAKQMVTYGRLFHALYDADSTLTKEQKKDLMTVPLHVGNAVLRSPKYRLFDDVFSCLRVIVLAVENFTVLPLQCCLVAAILQLHDSLDGPTAKALHELVDATTVVALVELAIGLKAFLWGFAYVGEVYKYNIVEAEPLEVVEK